MDVVCRKHLTQCALTDLEEVVLDVLHEAGAPLRGGEISKRIDIPVSKFVTVSYPLVHGVLESLACKGLVRQPMRDTGEYSWELTEKAKETMNTFLYFAYGSNMSERRLKVKERAPSAKVIGPAFLKNHCLTFHKRSCDGSGKCTIEYSESNKVYGVLFKIDIADKCKLDKAEGAGRNGGYKEETFKVELCNAKCKEYKDVKTYIAKCNYIDRTLKPYTWYKQHVLVGAIEQKLPPRYIDYLMGIEAKEHCNKEKEKCELSIYAICQEYHEIVKR